MSLFDICILLFLVPFVILGFRDGFLKRVLGILAFIIGFVVAMKSMAPIGELVSRNYHWPREMANLVAFFVVFVVILVLKFFIYHWLHGRRAEDTPKFFSKIAGGLLGGLQGTIAASSMLILLFVIGLPPEKMKQNSVLYGTVFSVAPTIYDYSTMWMPESKTFLDELEDELKHPNNPR